MKKLIGSVAIAAMVAGAAFAEIGLGSWGRSIAVPIASDGDINYAWEGTSWSGNSGISRQGFSVFASSENCGFNVDICGENVTQNDTAFMWAKPIDQLEVRIGRIQEATGRGNMCWGLWDWVRPQTSIVGEDFTYMRTTNTGYSVKVTPIDNLWLVAAVDVKDGEEWWHSYVSDNTRYGIGYDVPDMMSIRAQVWTRYITPDSSYNKDGSKTDVNYCVINPAIDITAVENLFITVGAYIPTAQAFNKIDNGKTSTKDPLQVNLGVNYNLDAVALHFAVGTKFGLVTGFDTKGEVEADGFGLTVGGGADFDLGNSLSVVADFRYVTQYYAADMGKNDALYGLVGLNKALTNGSIGVGFEFGGNCGVPRKADKLDSGVFTWSVPVVLTMGF